MAKVKIKVKTGTKGKALGTRVAEFKAKEGEKGKVIAAPKAKMTVHINDGRA